MHAEHAEFKLLISLREAATACGLSLQTLRNWSCSGRLPFATVRVGGRVLVRRADLVAWVAGLGGDQAPTSSSNATPALPGSAAPAPRRRGRPRMGTAQQRGGAK